MPAISDERMKSIRASLREVYIWIQIDETTDSRGRCVTNIVAGPLDDSRKVRLISFNTNFYSTLGSGKSIFSLI